MPLQNIYISNALGSHKQNGKVYGNKVFQELKQHFGDRLITISNNNNNVWCRDYMPLQTQKGNLIQFCYNPSYMESDSMQKLLPVAHQIHAELNLSVLKSSDLIIDGGNIELLGSSAIVSDRVFRDNSGWGRDKVIAELTDLLDINKLIIIPQYPFDFTGHVDGLVRFIDEETVLINDFTEEIKYYQNHQNSYIKKMMDQWHNSFLNMLNNTGLKAIKLPYVFDENQKSKSAKGIYLNFLHLEDCIVAPAFGYKDEHSGIDKRACEVLEECFNKKVIQIDSSELAAEGGIINCVTWSMK